MTLYSKFWAKLLLPFRKVSQKVGSLAQDWGVLTFDDHMKVERTSSADGEVNARDQEKSSRECSAMKSMSYVEEWDIL